MAKITSIERNPHYFHFHFTGPFEHLEPMRTEAEKIVDTCQEHKINNLLVDLSKIEGIGDVSTLEEHELAQFIEEIVSYRYRVAILFPQLSNNPRFLIGKHLENTAVNRGIQLRVFWSLKDSLEWISQQTPTAEGNGV